MKHTSSENNEAPWPSFGHVGVWYAQRSSDALERIALPVTAIQRWWRKQSLPCDEEYVKSLLIAVEYIRFNRKLLHLDRKIAAYEKLDGTNFGVRCDGEVFGRRFRVTGDTYQRVHLRGAIPTGEQVAAIKYAISHHESTHKAEVGSCNSEAEVPITKPKLVLYGELMCNPTKYQYRERFENCLFFCFGAVLDPMTPEGTRISCEDMMSIYNRLNSCGILAEMSPKTGCIRMSMNELFASFVTAEGIQCTPMLSSGSLREVCFNIKETLLCNNMEGVVLTGKGCLLKWKTSIEDESKGYAMLSNLANSYSKEVLEFAGIDTAFVQLLMDIAKNDNSNKRVVEVAKKRMARAKAKEAKPDAPFTNEAMGKAWVSATSKYDTLNIYFERGERDVIRNYLIEELVTEFSATEGKEIKYLEKFVNKILGAAFGKWKSENG